MRIQIHIFLCFCHSVIFKFFWLLQSIWLHLIPFTLVVSQNSKTIPRYIMSTYPFLCLYVKYFSLQGSLLSVFIYSLFNYFLVALFSNLRLLIEFVLHREIWSTTNVFNIVLFPINAIGIHIQSNISFN